MFSLVGKSNSYLISSKFCDVKLNNYAANLQKKILIIALAALGCLTICLYAYLRKNKAVRQKDDTQKHTLEKKDQNLKGTTLISDEILKLKSPALITDSVAGSNPIDPLAPLLLSKETIVPVQSEIKPNAQTSQISSSPSFIQENLKDLNVTNQLNNLEVPQTELKPNHDKPNVSPTGLKPKEIKVEKKSIDPTLDWCIDFPSASYVPLTEDDNQYLLNLTNQACADIQEKNVHFEKEWNKYFPSEETQIQPQQPALPVAPLVINVVSALGYNNKQAVLEAVKLYQSQSPTKFSIYPKNSADKAYAYVEDQLSNQNSVYQTYLGVETKAQIIEGYLIGKSHPDGFEILHLYVPQMKENLNIEKNLLFNLLKNIKSQGKNKVFFNTHAGVVQSQKYKEVIEFYNLLNGKKGLIVDAVPEFDPPKKGLGVVVSVTIDLSNFTP